jgi:hypothetical protein
LFYQYSITSGYSGNGYLKSFVEVVPATFSTAGYSLKSPEVKYMINFNSTGVFYVWIRAIGVNTQSSIFIGIDGSEVNFQDSLEISSVSSFTWFNSKNSGRYSINIPSTGMHSLHIWLRNGTVEVDKIILTKDSAFTPSGADESQTSYIGTSYPSIYQNISHSNPGVFVYSLWYNSELQSFPISNESSLVLLNKGKINAIHPRGTINRQLTTITLFTDIPYFNFTGIVDYYLKFGSVYVKATQSGSKFSCSFTSPANEFTIIQIQLVARNVKNLEELIISDNIVDFYFYGRSLNLLILEPIAWINHFPYVTKANQTQFSISAQVSSIPIENSTNLFCRVVTASGDVNLQIPERISFTEVKCNLLVPKLSLLNSEQLSIGLWVNASTSEGEYSFYISNNVTHLIIAEPFSSSIPSIISTGNLGSSFSINVSSLSISHLTTKIIMTPEYSNGDVEYTAFCSQWVCNIPQISIPNVPLKVNVKAFFKWGSLLEINITGTSFYYTGIFIFFKIRIFKDFE